MITAEQLETLRADERRAAARALIAQASAHEKQLRHKQALIDKLTHENANLKRLKFAASHERFREGYTAEQRSLLEETLDTDMAELQRELANLGVSVPEDEEEKKQKSRAKRQALPTNLPRTEHHHEPESTVCATPGCGCQMKRIRQDVSERLDHQPGTFTVERHIRGKWACGACQKLVQAPVAPHIIDKGIPTTGLLAQVLVAKYLDLLPL